MTWSAIVRTLVTLSFFIMAPVKKVTWDAVMGPLGEYFMEENRALRKEVTRLNSAYSSLYTSRLLSMQNYMEQCERLEQENMGLRAESNSLRHWNREHQRKIVSLCKKRDQAVKLARYVNRDNIGFQRIAKTNGVLLKLRAIPDAYFKSIEHDSDETNDEESGEEDVTTQEDLA